MKYQELVQSYEERLLKTQRLKDKEGLLCNLLQLYSGKYEFDLYQKCLEKQKDVCSLLDEFSDLVNQLEKSFKITIQITLGIDPYTLLTGQPSNFVCDYDLEDYPYKYSPELKQKLNEAKVQIREIKKKVKEVGLTNQEFTCVVEWFLDYGDSWWKILEERFRDIS